MGYRQFQPHKSLAPYIDAYWTVTSEGSASKTEKILPDGCIDIILNFGADCSTDNDTFTLKNEAVYLVGTMTRFKETVIQPGTKLLGIRFKPGAFGFFYNYDALHELTNHTVAFEKALSPDLKTVTRQTVAYLNQFFFDKLRPLKQSLLPVIADIQHYNGQVDVGTLAQRHFTTTKQLERNFKRYVGTSPKAFINLIRYQAALHKIQRKEPGRSLLEIALECGYYDHSHLTNEMKKFAGVIPSDI